MTNTACIFYAMDCVNVTWILILYSSKEMINVSRTLHPLTHHSVIFCHALAGVRWNLDLDFKFYYLDRILGKSAAKGYKLKDPKHFVKRFAPVFTFLFKSLLSIASHALGGALTPVIPGLNALHDSGDSDSFTNTLQKHKWNRNLSDGARQCLEVMCK